ncbi:MAG: cytochrome c [Gammaproteobacteria bacterium]|jgi:hypothetical protein|nr:cytochrome c [Gammaproteobacteria bacterium]MBT3489171.1 cytochrome c [Gammaproteobacteria bacterium]MBT3717566.1 cytochrome c [Gammaproteobacteria bacterium]MBT3845319.1 cytochrome c [Gammaproteobacteria bacterium]MBT3892520.1 cytochrome c [Gammaproteobacteria bacterium]
MNKTIITSLLSSLLLVGTLSSQAAADTENGQELHDKDCLGCHGTEVYTREGRTLSNFFDLKRQVSMCITMTGKGSDWFPDDQTDVVEYMNASFYHFKP